MRGSTSGVVSYTDEVNCVCGGGSNSLSDFTSSGGELVVRSFSPAVWTRLGKPYAAAAALPKRRTRAGYSIQARRQRFPEETQALSWDLLSCNE